MFNITSKMTSLAAGSTPAIGSSRIYIFGILASLLVFAFIGISIAINVNVILNFNLSHLK